MDDDNNILYKCTLHVLHESIKLNYQVHVGNLSKKMQEYKERSIQDLFLSLTSCLNRQMGRDKLSYAQREDFVLLDSGTSRN